MGASVGIGALIMGVTLLSLFAVASTMLTDQIEVALEVTEPQVTEKPEVTITNAADSGSATGVNVDSPGTGYYPGTLVFSSVCTVSPSGTYTVSSESFTFQAVAEAGNYDGLHFTFQELDDEAGAVTDWYVWYDVGNNDVDPAPGGTGIEVDLAGGETAEQVRDLTHTELTTQNAALDQMTFTTQVTDEIVVTYDQSGPAVDFDNATSPIIEVVSSDGGLIDGAALGTTPSGSGCSTTPTVAPSDAGGGNGAISVTTMEWDVTFDLTNEGDTSLPIDEFFVILDDENTPAIIEEPTVLSDSYSTSGYIFPGETISVTIDQNSGAVHTRIAISSHGASVGAAL